MSEAPEADKQPDEGPLGGTLQRPLTRQQLYELAWEKPMLHVAEQFGVSSSYLARVYTELRVPRPAPGYWTQREMGKSPPIPGLPPARPGDAQTWSPGTPLGSTQRAAMGRARQAKAEDASAVADAERSLAASHQTAAVEANPRPRGRPRKYPVRAERHELLIGVKAHFLKTRPVENGILRPYKRLLVDVLASEAKLDMALEVAQTLFAALERRGHRVAIASTQATSYRDKVELAERPTTRTYYDTIWSPDRPTVAYIGETGIGLTLHEMTEEVETVYVGSGYGESSYLEVRDLSAMQLKRFAGPHHWRSHKVVPSGPLCLQAYCPHGRVNWVRRWPEAKAGSMVSMVPSIVSELEAKAAELTRLIGQAEIKAAEERRQWEEDCRRHAEEAERQRQAKAREVARTELLSAISAWDEAQRILRYFDAVAAEIDRRGGDGVAPLQERLDLARALIGTVDPLEFLQRWRSPQERL